MTKNPPAAAPPLLAVGLGNPGAPHHAQRHNAGFWFADALAARNNAVFQAQKKFFGEVAAAAPPILKPSTYMNDSGRAVAAYLRYYKMPPETLLVAHDEADLPPGAVRLKFGGSAAGHNGIADINNALQNCPYWRLRIGIGRTAADIADYVLTTPTADERAHIDEAICHALQVWADIAVGHWEKAMLVLHSPPPTADSADGDAHPHPTPLNHGA